MARFPSLPAAAGGLLMMMLLAACGGGGGGGGTALPIVGSATATPTATATAPPLNATPTAAPTGQPAGPQLAGTMQLASGTYPNFALTAETQGSLVVFTCGCTSQAGENVLAAGGTFDIPASAAAIPASPSPTYTSVPGRTYLVVATQNGGSTTQGNGPESWQLEFLGSTPSRNLGLGANSSTSSDPYTALGALYVYNNSQNGNSATAFDDWNFNSVLAWVNAMRAGTNGLPNSAEQKLLNDIAAAQQNGSTLYPIAPPWYPSLNANSTIKADLSAVSASGDSSIPTPCPSTGCTGTPTP